MSDYTREAFERDRFATAGPVQPPATPQEPDVRGDIGHQNAEIQRLGNAVRDGSATSEMAYAWLTHPYVCTSDMVKAAARIMASTPSPEGQTWQVVEPIRKKHVRDLLATRGARAAEKREHACSSLTIADVDVLLRALPSPPTPEGTQP